MSKHLTTFKRKNLVDFYTPRNGETKMGDTIPLLKNESELQSSSSPFVMIGIAEDIGVRGNLGIPGCSTTF